MNSTTSEGPRPGLAWPELRTPVPRAYTMAEADTTSSLGSTEIHEGLSPCRLRSVRLPGRRLLLREDLLAWLQAARDGPN
jgi:hypothetical protein